SAQYSGSAAAFVNYEIHSRIRGTMNQPAKLGMLACALLLATAASAATRGWPAPGPMPPEDNRRLAHDIFRQIVEIRSVHPVGTKGVAEALYARFKAAGFTDKEMNLVPEGPWPHQVNLVVRVKGKGSGKPVMWICHLDVVDARPEDW